MKMIKKIFIKLLLILRLVLTGCAVFALVYGSYLFMQAYRTTRVFDLKKIIVKNCRLLTPGDVISLSEIKRGTRIGDIDLTYAEKKVSSSPYVKKSAVKRIYPATVVITVWEDDPVAYLNSAGTLRYVNRNGAVLGKAKPGEGYDLPVIVSGDTGTAASFIQDCLSTSMFTYHHISEVAVTDRGIELYLVKSSAPVIIGKDDYRKKIVILENFLKNEYNDLTFSRIEYIDLRFDRQVVLKEFSIAEK